MAACPDFDELRDGGGVRRGDPDVVAAADSLEFEHKYTSAVIAWAADRLAVGRTFGFWLGLTFCIRASR